jgi:hypothetical protein
MTYKEFESKFGYKLRIRDGRAYCDETVDLFCKDEDCDSLVELPEGLTINGTLFGSRRIAKLPDDIKVNGSVVLEGCTKLVSLPNDFVVDGILNLSYTHITSLPKGLVVRDNLLLIGTNIEELPDDLVVGGDLDLSISHIKSLPENLTIGGNLILCGCTDILSLPKGLKIGGFLVLRDVNIESLPDDIIIYRDITLYHLKGFSIPENFTVYGDLSIIECNNISLPENLTVNRLYVRYTKNISLSKSFISRGSISFETVSNVSIPEGFTVYKGFQIFNSNIESPLNGFKISNSCPKKLVFPDPVFIWESNGKQYIKVDNIFSIIDRHRGNMYIVHNLDCEKQRYVVTDGEGHYAHGDTKKEAKEDLIFKISDRDTSLYKGMSLDDVFTYEEAIIAYRTITGACSAGTRNFIEKSLPKPHKNKYTIREIIKLTENQYGNDKFKKFFL